MFVLLLMFVGAFGYVVDVFVVADCCWRWFFVSLMSSMVSVMRVVDVLFCRGCCWFVCLVLLLLWILCFGLCCY